MFGQGERGVEQTLSVGDGQRQNHAVRLVNVPGGDLGGEAGSGLLGLAQGIGMDCVAVLGQQLGLPQIASHYPYVQFVFHGEPS